ncbi:class I SAM-dependent methyltransferase [Cellulomonas carbonis]|uniref:SAM-dependent methyltransferase n=1 Tax=Cellulomonas carbonis T26 TaxID=947969 RepID=A0A0A0BVE3_9CELL|nr:class I SAM-dependent methyltransferase [Cellulomonas carbonis]KGM11950.1 SAM-dependent methyltransferase [Cellulomonas carbonis T26]GGB95387.1 SAM-dependent methyltransferase [Cellulomonas carbonis]
MSPPNLGFAGYRPTSDDGGAARSWWDANAEDYLAEHGDFLGAADFVWCPEGLREADAGLLGDVRGRRVVEVGAGAAQCSRWLVGQGALAVATDVSSGMLRNAVALSGRTGVRVPVVQADARSLPFADASVDVAFTAYGALPFVPDATAVHREAARVLRPGGRWVFSVTHPVRWAFPDDPGEGGLTATRSYFDRTPYVEVDDEGNPAYAEFHRTLGDHVRDVVAAGLRIVDLVEPEWPAGHERTWGGWSRLRGERIPGTVIVVTIRD